jgi:hypothetical protein
LFVIDAPEAICIVTCPSADEIELYFHNVRVVLYEVRAFTQFLNDVLQLRRWFALTVSKTMI